MKIYTLKYTLFALVFLFSFISINGSCQVNSAEQEIEKDKVPAAVKKAFALHHPTVAENDWYGYPTFDEVSNWYAYDPRVNAVDAPQYYIAKFQVNGAANKVIYSADGKKVATYNKLQREGFPAEVNKAFLNSEYNGWEQVGEKEEITRGTGNEKVYKITVEKDAQQHELFYDKKGKLLKDRTTDNK